MAHDDASWLSTVWSTLRSYALTVDVGADGVKRVSVEPIVHDGYVPKGAVGAPSSKILRETAGVSSNQFSLSESSLEAVPNSSPVQSKSIEFEGNGTVYAGASG